MQTANIFLALGGDLRNTVPKPGVTAAEIAVLRQIHGEQSVIEVEPADDIKRRNIDELQRLRYIYGAAKNTDNKSIVETMFPGVGARVPDTLEELNLAPEQYAAEKRIVPKSSRAAKADKEAKTTETASETATEKRGFVD